MLQTIIFLIDFESAYMKSVQDAADKRMTLYNELHFLIERT